MSLKLFGGRLRVNVFFVPAAALMCALTGTEMFMAFTAALLLHELAHAAAARAARVSVTALSVYPFGCAAELGGFSAVSGGSEVVIAAAGPAVNMVAAAGAFALSGAAELAVFEKNFLTANLVLAGINLLPVMPLDGGRIMRALLSLAVGETRAAKITGISGIVIAAAVISLGVAALSMGVFNPTPFFMGGFMMLGALSSMKNASFDFMRRTTQKGRAVCARPAVDASVFAVNKRRSAAELMRSLDGRRYNIVYVLDDDMNIVRVIGEGELRREIMEKGVQTPVGELHKNA